MRPGRPTCLVLAVAAATAVILAPVAQAGPAREEPDPDEAHGGASEENPYEDAPQNRQAIVRPQQLQVRDGMIKLPGGHFLMGSTSGRAPANERPSRPTVVPPFWIDRTEVTVGAYRKCVEAGACPHPARASATCTFDAGDPELPVSCVHWSDADAYCRFAGKRLPVESEWEYAARGTYSLAFPWGRVASCAAAVTLVNDQSGVSCLRRPARVGTHPGGASVFGVQDMSGNVEEWTADWYSESLGPTPVPRSGAAHVLRGGGWQSPPLMSRTTSRDWGSALEAGPNVGFRCAKQTD